MILQFLIGAPTCKTPTGISLKSRNSRAGLLYSENCGRVPTDRILVLKGTTVNVVVPVVPTPIKLYITG